MSQLRALSEHHNFNYMLEDMLRDKIVCGFNDDTIQQQVLAKCELSFKKVVEVAQGMKTAARHVTVIVQGDLQRLAWHTQG